MQHADLAHGDMIANEVKIDLGVFGALMLDGVRGHVDGANIVAEHNCSRRRWSIKLMEEHERGRGDGDGGEGVGEGVREGADEGDGVTPHFLQTLN
jgi:hypothetical protein